MYLPVALLAWFATLLFVISDITITVTPTGLVSLTLSRGPGSANSRLPSSTTVLSIDLSTTGIQSSKRMSSLILLTCSVNFISTLSSSGPLYQKLRLLTPELPYLEATSAPLGPISTFKSSAKLPVEETTSLLLIIYITSGLALASTKSFSGSLTVRNDKKLASIVLAFVLAFIVM
jgi:hypothetical protein